MFVLPQGGVVGEYEVVIFWTDDLEELCSFFLVQDGQFSNQVGLFVHEAFLFLFLEVDLGNFTQKGRRVIEICLLLFGCFSPFLLPSFILALFISQHQLLMLCPHFPVYFGVVAIFFPDQIEEGGFYF